MAEGLLRAPYGDRFDGYRAGTEATEVRPLAVEVMKELDIDISGHESKSVDQRRDVFRRVRDELTDWIDTTFTPPQ